jgi:hypothetical protein
MPSQTMTDSKGREITTTLVKWLSTAGYPQERWDVYRGSFLMGSISHCQILEGWSNSGKYGASLADEFKSRYFVRFNSAVEWIARMKLNTYPISELASFINSGDY